MALATVKRLIAPRSSIWMVLCRDPCANLQSAGVVVDVDRDGELGPHVDYPAGANQFTIGDIPSRRFSDTELTEDAHAQALCDWV
jgi:hypothetical protein